MEKKRKIFDEKMKNANRKPVSKSKNYNGHEIKGRYNEESIPNEEPTKNNRNSKIENEC
jgi:hypothetical protein